MIETCIKKQTIIDFADNIEGYIFGCSDSLDRAKVGFKKLFSKLSSVEYMFFKQIPVIKKQLQEDLSFYLESDPAANNEEEILACYPGYKAIVYYRIAHILYTMGYKVEARIISEQAHLITGIDIHPGATIGCPFFIDHGTGVVIGETSIVGNRVKIYQGVTLGAISLSRGHEMKGTKRHPTIEDNVTIYSNASILGGDVVIGHDCTIGSNVFLTESVPENYKVFISKPELVFKKK